MKLPSYLALSRHGVFYFRLTFFVGSIRKEKRWSLHTKNPVEAKRLSLKICASLGDNSVLNSIRTLAGHTQSDARLVSSEISGGIATMAEDKKVAAGYTAIFQSRKGSTMKLEVDQSDPADVAAAQELAKTFIQEDAKSPDPDNWEWLQNSNLMRNDIVQDVIAGNAGQAGTSIEELIDKYQIRQADRLSKKTLYEYEKMQRKYATWLKSGKNNGEVTLSDEHR